MQEDYVRYNLHMLYTKKGDDGTTKLFDCPQGTRLRKDEIIFEALGTVDEVNSAIGYAKSLVLSQATEFTLVLESEHISLQDTLEKIQNILFSVQAELAGSKNLIQDSHIEYFEHIIASVESVIPPITTFLIPGGDPISGYLDVCRTVARRAERLAISARSQYEDRVSLETIQLLNRLSSVLYALARFVNHEHSVVERPPVYK